MSALLKSLNNAVDHINHESYNDALSSLAESIAAYTKQLESTQDIINVQCNDGNWNYDPYMHGMANGMIIVQSMFTDKEPDFLEAPEVWLESLDSDGSEVAQQDKS
jgi:hypothetical protein